MTTAELVIKRKCDPNRDPNAIGPWQYSVLMAGYRHYSPELKCSWNQLSGILSKVSDVLRDDWRIDVLSSIDGRWYEWPITKKSGDYGR